MKTAFVKPNTYERAENSSMFIPDKSEPNPFPAG